MLVYVLRWVKPDETRLWTGYFFKVSRVLLRPARLPLHYGCHGETGPAM